jgi:hypothetical protein
MLSGVVLLCGGCVATAHGSAYAEADAPVVFTSEPTLVEVDSGVWVVRDYDQPVYFVDDDYWVFRDGIWYRSHSYEGGWARVDVNVIPAVIVHRDHRMFVHYHGAATAQTRVAPRRGHGDERRGPPENAAEAKGGPPGQVEKEHREERREERQEERHEARADDHGGHDDHGMKHEEKKEDKKDDKKHKKH